MSAPISGTTSPMKSCKTRDSSGMAKADGVALSIPISQRVKP